MHDSVTHLFQLSLEYHQNFVDFSDKVVLIYSRDNVLLSKQDMLRYTVRPDSDKTVIKSRQLIEVEGGHDIQVENYDSLVKILSDFLG